MTEHLSDAWDGYIFEMRKPNFGPDDPWKDWRSAGMFDTPKEAWDFAWQFKVLPTDPRFRLVHVVGSLSETRDLVEVELCFSRGPRIGDEGRPACKLAKGHDGPHKPAPSDGWEDTMEWSDW